MCGVGRLVDAHSRDLYCGEKNPDKITNDGVLKCGSAAERVWTVSPRGRAMHHCAYTSLHLAAAPELTLRNVYFYFIIVPGDKHAETSGQLEEKPKQRQTEKWPSKYSWAQITNAIAGCTTNERHTSANAPTSVSICLGARYTLIL